MRLGQRQDTRRVLEIDADADGVADAVLAHRFEQLRQILGEIRKIEMTVAIDQHGYDYGITWYGSGASTA